MALVNEDEEKCKAIYSKEKSKHLVVISADAERKAKFLQAVTKTREATKANS